MGILVEDEHPAACFAILHKVFDLLLLFLGVVIIIVAILYLVVIDTLHGLFSIVLVLGIVMAGVSVVALFGSGYYEPARSDRLICLQLNFIFLLIAGAVFLICALFCFITPDVVVRLLTRNWDSMMSFIDTLPENMQSVGEVLTTLMNKPEIIGVIFISLAFLLLADMSLSILLMGMRVFIETLCRYGSVALAILGGLILAVVVYLYSVYPGLVKTFQIVAIAAAVLGGFCLLVGLSGIFLSCSCITTKVTCPLFLISVSYLALGVLCFTGVILVYSLSDKIVDYAGSTVSLQCLKTEKYAETYTQTQTVEELGVEECTNFQTDFKTFFCNATRQIDPCPAPEEDSSDSSTEDDDEEKYDECACKTLVGTQAIGQFISIFAKTIERTISELRFIILIALTVIGTIIAIMTLSFFYYWYKARQENKLYKESVERRKNMGLLTEEEDEENYNIRDRGGGFANNAERIQQQEQAELMAQQQLLERYAERKEQQKNLKQALKQSAQEAQQQKKQEKQEQRQVQQAINVSLQQDDWGFSDYMSMGFTSQYPQAR